MFCACEFVGLLACHNSLHWKRRTTHAFTHIHEPNGEDKCDRTKLFKWKCTLNSSSSSSLYKFIPSVAAFLRYTMLSQQQQQSTVRQRYKVRKDAYIGHLHNLRDTKWDVHFVRSIAHMNKYVHILRCVGKNGMRGHRAGYDFGQLDCVMKWLSKCQ